MMQQGDLSNVQAGDQVIRARARGQMNLVEVARVTKARIYTQYHEYRKSDGLQICANVSRWYKSRIYPTTEENLLEMQKTKAIQDEQSQKREVIRWLKRVSWDRLKLEELKKLAASAGWVLGEETGDIK